METMKKITVFFIAIYTILVITNFGKIDYDYKLLDKYLVSKKINYNFNKKEKKYITNNISKYKIVLKNVIDIENNLMIIIIFFVFIILIKYYINVLKMEKDYE